jgi:alpha-ribazole phosphatase
MIVLLVRHPAPDVPAGVCYGRQDLPLRADSLALLPSLAAEIHAHGIATVRASPAKRCRLLADFVVAMAHRSLLVDPRLQELDFGAWEGVAWDDIPREELDRWAADPLEFAPPGGESGAALVARVRQVHQAIVAAREDCAVIAHGGPLKVLAALLRGKSPDLLAPAQPFGSIIPAAC